MKKSPTTRRVSDTGVQGKPLSLSSLVAATEKDHNRLLKEDHPKPEPILVTEFQNIKGGRDDSNEASANYQGNNVHPPNQSLNLDEFMDIISIKCRLCEDFVCSNKLQLANHIKYCYKQKEKHKVMQYKSKSKLPTGTLHTCTTEQQKQLVSSLLELANFSETKKLPQNQRKTEEGEFVTTSSLKRSENNQDISQYDFSKPHHGEFQHRMSPIQSENRRSDDVFESIQLFPREDSISIRTDENHTLHPSADFRVTSSQIRTNKNERDVVLCGVCSRVFSSSDQCNHHIYADHSQTKTEKQVNEMKGIKSSKPISHSDTTRKETVLLESDASLNVTSEGIHNKNNLSGVQNISEILVSSNEKETAVKRRRKRNTKYDNYSVADMLPIIPLISQQKQRRDFKCPYSNCLCTFSASEVLQNHELCHTAKEDDSCCKFICSQAECESAQTLNGFHEWKACALHLWSKHNLDVGLLSCPLCSTYKTATRSKLDIHMLIHSEDRQFACSVCKKRFKQLSQLRNHSVSHMDKESEVVPIWYSKKKCELCGKCLSDSKCLKKHIQTVHSKLKPYICQVCNHQSARKSMLELHMRQHTGDKPYSCEVCQYKTGDHNSLRRHKMRHSGERPYKCLYCDYSSIQSEAYKNHILSKHSKKTGSKTNVFICPQCSYKTVKAESYFNHLKEKHSKDAEEDAKPHSSKEQEISNKEKSWLLNSGKSIHPLHEEKLQEKENLTSSEMSQNIHSLKEESNSITVDPPSKESPMETQESEHDIINAPFDASKKYTKRTKAKLAFAKKKAKKHYVISREPRKQNDKILEKDRVIDEEDSLHATTDLGGTTIAADPLKSETSSQ